MRKFVLALALLCGLGAFPVTPPAYYDVVAKGADPTGATDSAAAIRATINAACAFTTAIPVYIPPGSYRLDSGIQLPSCSNLRIYGAGQTTRLFAGVNPPGNALFFYITTGTTNTTIDHIWFDGSAATVGNDAGFIFVFQTNGVLLTDNDFTNNRSLVFNAQGNSNAIRMRHNWFHNASVWQQTLPTWAVNSGYNVNQLVYSPAGVGDYIQTVASCTSVALGLGPTGTGTGIVDGTCRWNYVRSSLVITNAFAGGSDNVFSDNMMDCCLGGDPLDALNQKDFQAIGNTIVSNNLGYVNQASAAGGGLYLYGDSEPGSVGGVIANNYIYGMTGNGIDIGCVKKIAVTGNVVLNSGGAGSALSGGPVCVSRQVTYTGNVFMNSIQAVAGNVPLTTSGTTGAGNNVLSFASTTGVVDGYFVWDGSGNTVAKGTKVLSHTATTVTMTTNAIGTGVPNAQAITFYNRYPAFPGPFAGIAIVCVQSACSQSDVALSGNIVTDDQATKTQPYGVLVSSNETITNLRIGQDNMLKGNATAEMTGPGAVYVDGGSGSNAWSCAPGANNTASGLFGSMACGFSATASGSSSRAMGLSVTAFGALSDVAGNAVNDGFRIGWQGYGSGQFATSGDAQAGRSVLRGSGATTAPIRVTSNGTAPSAGGFNCYAIPASRAHAVNLNVVAVDHTTPTNSISWLNWNGLMARPSTAASTTATMQTAPTPISNGTVTGNAIAVTADTTLGCLNISFTPPTGNTDTWNVVAEVRSTEVQ